MGVKTYIVEWPDRSIMSYQNTLADAKAVLKRHANSGSILMMVGNYFGEGWHQYRLYWSNNKYTRCKLR